MVAMSVCLSVCLCVKRGSCKKKEVEGGENFRRLRTEYQQAEQMKYVLKEEAPQVIREAVSGQMNFPSRAEL